MFEDLFFSKGIETLIENEKERLKTIGKVLNVKEEGLLVDAQMLYRAAGEESVNNIPVLKNKYFNSPIEVGDFVLLLTISHLVENFFLENKVFEKTPVELESYIAIPLVTKENFKHKNEISVLDKNFTLQINEEGVKVENKKKIDLKNNENIQIKSLENINIDANQKLVFSGKEAVKTDAGEFSVKSVKPITLKTDSANLSDLLNDIVTAINLASLSISASPGSPVSQNPALIPLLEKIKTTLKLLLA